MVEEKENSLETMQMQAHILVLVLVDVQIWAGHLNFQSLPFLMVRLM